MKAIPADWVKTVSIRSETSRQDWQKDLYRAQKLARLMDARFGIGRLRFGADSIIGLVPVAGDVIAFLIGLYPVFLAYKHQLGGWIIARMILNLGLDVVLGAVPVVGDFMDVFYKANLKNLHLLEHARTDHLQINP